MLQSRRSVEVFPPALALHQSPRPWNWRLRDWFQAVAFSLDKYLRAW
jgi:hypothetical protein